MILESVYNYPSLTQSNLPPRMTHLWTFKKPLGFMMNVPDIRNPVDVRDLSKEGNVESPKPVTGKIINPPLIIALADVEAGHISITKFVPTGIDIVVHVLGFAIRSIF